MKLTQHISILGQGASASGERFVRLRFCTRDGSRNALLRIDELLEGGFGALNRLGAHLITTPARNQFLARIQAAGPQAPTFPVATQLGWHSGAFVLPSRVIGAADDLQVYLDDLGDLTAKYRCRGTLKGWKKIPYLAIGNSRLILALALAFVGPIGPLLKARNVAIQLVDESGSAKTPMAIAAGSPWGCHVDLAAALLHGFGETWNNTTGHLERVALAHNHTFLILDETRLTDPKTVLESIFRFERGQEKGRLTDARPSRSWWVPVLSTSNLTVDQLGAAAAIPVDDAHRSRLIDIPPPANGYGMHEDLHGYADLGEFSKRLIELALRHYGYAGVFFLKKLVAWYNRDPKGLRTWLRARHAYYRRVAKSRFSSPGRDLLPIHERFATTYAAGCLAQSFKLLPWTWKELRAALLSCERDHVALIEQYRSAPSSRQTPIERLRRHINAKQAAFLKLSRALDTQGQLKPAPGYKNTYKGQREYLFTEQQFTTIVGGSSFAKALKTELHKLGHIATTGKASALRYAVKRPLSDGTRQYFVAISPDVRR